LAICWESSHCGCPFQITVSVAEQSLAQKLGIEVGSVSVLKAQFFHATGCLSSRMQLVESKIWIGNYSKPLQQQHLSHLISLIRNNTFVPAKIMGNAMRPLYPKSVPIDSQQIANTQLKIKAIIKKSGYQNYALWKLSDAESSYIVSDELTPPLSLLGKVVQEGCAPSLDDASCNAREILFELLKESHGFPPLFLGTTSLPGGKLS